MILDAFYRYIFVDNIFLGYEFLLNLYGVLIYHKKISETVSQVSFCDITTSCCVTIISVQVPLTFQLFKRSLKD